MLCRLALPPHFAAMLLPPQLLNNSVLSFAPRCVKDRINRMVLSVEGAGGASQQMLSKSMSLVTRTLCVPSAPWLPCRLPERVPACMRWHPCSTARRQGHVCSADPQSWHEPAATPQFRSHGKWQQWFRTHDCICACALRN